MSFWVLIFLWALLCLCMFYISVLCVCVCFWTLINWIVNANFIKELFCVCIFQYLSGTLNFFLDILGNKIGKHFWHFFLQTFKWLLFPPFSISLAPILSSFPSSLSNGLYLDYFHTNFFHLVFPSSTLPITWFSLYSYFCLYTSVFSF